MDAQKLIKKLPILQNRLNRYRLGCALLGLVVICQSVALLLNRPSSQTVLVPLHFQESFWVSREGISQNYLEAVGRFFAMLFLNLTPESADNQLAYLLKFASAKHYATLREDFKQLRDTFQKEGYSTNFFPQDAVTDVKNLTVILTGLLETHVGGKTVTQEAIQFRCRFTYDNGTLHLIEMGVIEDEVV